MNDERADLSPLDPENHPVHWREFVDRVALLAADQASAQARRSLEEPGLMRWARPGLVAAAMAAAASGFILMAPSGSATRAEVYGQLLGIPAPVAQWAVEGRIPAPAELYLRLAGPAR